MHEHVVSRQWPGPLNRDIDAGLLALVMSGCGIDEIVETLGIQIGEVHSRLLRLRLIIEDATRVPSDR